MPGVPSKAQKKKERKKRKKEEKVTEPELKEEAPIKKLEIIRPSAAPKFSVAESTKQKNKPNTVQAPS